ncbi:hypothetical protein HGM15179_002457 [Zosterops borbonicus]|uniref:Uncharacterized protein n=1 Tax=Zosterops borbonicus TaxID=364589 RepID=A0A8K1LS39_9PASS|nr:hypothetical protein HGM15179_002457 [Zosterops borbonicus]
MDLHCYPPVFFINMLILLFAKLIHIKLQRQDEDHQLRQKTLANPDKNHFLAKARRNSFLTTMPISSTFWCHKRNEINIRQTLGIDIRKEPSRNETTGLDEIREGHRKEIRTIQPTLDT